MKARPCDNRRQCGSGSLRLYIGIDTLVITGFLTDQCVDHTVRDAADRGFYPICISDACATHSRERHDNALAAFAGYCRTMSTQEMVGLSTGRQPDR